MTGTPTLDNTALDAVVAEHLAAVNAFDEAAIMATFADDALVNDAHREFWGAEAIRRWVAREMVGDKVSHGRPSPCHRLTLTWLPGQPPPDLSAARV